MKTITATTNADSVECYDFVEISLVPSSLPATNPFTSVRVSASVTCPDATTFGVDGFCDSDDGSLYRVRVMPRTAGRYTVRVSYQDGSGGAVEHDVSFGAVEAGRKGVVVRDPDYPMHFLWEGTGEHHFANGTTCYYLLGWKDDAVIRREIDRLADYGVNRVRVLLYGRQFDNPWGTPVRNTDEFSMLFNPWHARFPDDPTNPEFELSRFNVDHWRKYERLLAHARERDVVVSVVMFIGAQVLPVPFGELSEDEYRYYRYAVARLAAYSNITWDIGNEHDFHRAVPFWANGLGEFVSKSDPYGHLVAAHNKFYRSGRRSWVGMQLLQIWDAGLNEHLAERRREQAETGAMVPHVIEEYGYEDLWERFPGHRSAETRRRCAWEVYMAGGYQTNGETAERGVGERADSGGGWVSGRGDETMTMFAGFRPIVEFFTSFEWWKAEPANHAVTSYSPVSPEKISYYARDGRQVPPTTAFCCAEPDKVYAVYLPAGGTAELHLPDGSYEVERWNARTGERKSVGRVDGPNAVLGDCPDREDWAFLVRRA